MTRVNSTGKELSSNFSPDNGTGLAVRTAIKDILESLRTVNSAAGDPSGAANLAAYQLHIDSDTDTLKIRNGANSAFVTLGNVSQTNFGFLSASGGTLTGVLGVSAGSSSAPALHFGDTNTGLFKKSTNQIGIATAGIEQLFLDQNGITLNQQNEIKFGDSDSSNFAAIKAPSSIGSDYTLTLPTTAGSDGQFLKVGSSGALSFASTTDITSVGTLNGLTVSNTTNLSELKVTKIIPTGGVASGAGGGIIQVVPAFTTSSTSTDDNAFKDIDGLTVTITPNSTSSKFLIMASFTVGHGGNNGAVILNLVRNGENIAQGTDSIIPCTSILTFNNGTQNDNNVFNYSYQHVDTTTLNDLSDITYKYQVKSANDKTTKVNQRPNNQTDLKSTGNLIVCEISG
tara:strand:+ start:1167 stop:2363 length:1197 start_codon:yes stop_codon:yes gene_type:complete